MRVSIRLAATIGAAWWCSSGLAQQVGYVGNAAIPLVAETASYASQIFVHNPGPNPLGLAFTYFGATQSATPGTVSCNELAVAAGKVVKTSLAALCPALNPGSNFGALLSTGGLVAMYSRVQTPAGNGFSIEGMNDYAYSGGVREAIGLVRQAAAPTYQTNCFVFNQEPRPGRVVVTLVGGDGGPIAAQLIALKASEFVRLIDVFAALGAPPGDYTNVRATFETIVPFEGGSPVGVASSCTVQNNTTFDADFRVAKYHF